MKRVSCLLLTMMAVQFCAAQTITVKGSTSLAPATERWATEYTKTKPSATIKVLAGGSSTGFEALLANTAELAASSRKITPKEKSDITAKRGKAPLEFKVAMDGVAIFVNASNNVQKLTVAQLTDILTGKATNWLQVGGADKPITIYGRDANSGTFSFMKEHVLKGKDFSPGAKQLTSSVQIIASVGNDTGGIGYGSIEFGKSVKHVKISEDAASAGVEPTRETIENGKYPLSRVLYIYSAGTPTGLAHDFLKFVLSDPGQAHLTNVGLFPLSSKDRAAMMQGLE